MMPAMIRKARTKVGLSRRESEILTLLSQGLLYKEVGGALNISINTVRTHVVSIYRKLEVHSRTEAVLSFFKG